MYYFVVNLKITVQFEWFIDVLNIVFVCRQKVNAADDVEHAKQ